MDECVSDLQYETDDAGHFVLSRQSGENSFYRLFYWCDPDDSDSPENGWTIALFDSEGNVPQAELFPDLESAMIRFGEMGGFNPED